jgi:hypothetical protein
VLVYEEDGDVFPLGREIVEGSFDNGVLGFAVDDEEVLLRVWGFGDVLVDGQSCPLESPRRR